MSSGDRSGLSKQELDFIRRQLEWQRELELDRIERLMAQEQSQDPIERDLRRVVQSVMTCTEVVTLLNAHGCVDLTHSLDLSSCTEHPIANGGLGDVFRGELIDGTPVAIKLLRAYGDTGTPNGTYQKRAAREIYTWSKCKHPNVVSLTGLAVFRNSLAMISRWEGNGNLTSYLSRNKDADRCLLSQSICAGLAYLHKNDIIHGDLKGANVLIAHDGTPMLMDFGNASLLGATLQFTQTKSGTNYSLQWTAPEILREKTGHTKAGDIYALGMTILEAFTGEIPYPNKKDHVVLTLVLNAKKTPKRPKEAIPETSVSGNTLWAILQSCWSYNPKRRPSAKTVWKMMTLITSDMLKEVEDEPEEDVSMEED